MIYLIEFNIKYDDDDLNFTAFQKFLELKRTFHFAYLSVKDLITHKFNQNFISSFYVILICVA